jgi:glycosyltransferase involved in cell wall biosynthesis
MIQNLLSKCTYLTFVSNVSRIKIKSDLDIKGKTEVVYPGSRIDQPDLNAVNGFIKKYNVDQRAPIVTFIGPLEWKLKVEGVRKLIDAFEIAYKEYPNALLLIVGDGKYKDELLKRIKNRGLEKNVIITGFLVDVSTPLYLTDIYAHISLQEGLPISMLEAMKFGKPIIASKTGGIPEVINNGKNGLLINSNPDEIAEAIISLYKDKDKMRMMGAEALKTVQEKFTWNIAVDQFLQLYKGAQ